jgi:hypothetical protein
MTILYLAMLLCYMLMPLSLIIGQGFLIVLLAIIALLIRRQMVLEQQVAFLLHQSEVKQMRQALQGRDIQLPQMPQVRGL